MQRERIHGVHDAMTAAGLDPDSLTVVESYEHLPTSGGAAAEVALDANPRITALMCTADVLALSAMDYLRARGIYVPGQMTVTGFDGVPEALRRGLTTVVQPSMEKGRRAGRLLHNPPRSGLPVIDVLDTEVVRGRTPARRCSAVGPHARAPVSVRRHAEWRCHFADARAKGTRSPRRRGSAHSSKLKLSCCASACRRNGCSVACSRAGL